MTEKIIVFDTTLRDGEQSSGFHMYPEEKLAIAKALAEMGVDVIEAGNPVSSDGDFNAVERICSEVKGATICGLARCVEKDIIAAGNALQPAIKEGKGRIHVYIGTSAIHAEKKLRKSKEEIIKMAVESILKAKQFTNDVEFSCEDFARSEPVYTVEIISEAIKAGATTINLPDTVGYRLPFEVTRMIGCTIKNIEQKIGKQDLVYSVHCHNDLGLATANTLAAILGGARQIEVTINGIGERAGNASLEEVVAAIKERNDFFQLETGKKFEIGLDTKKIYSLSQMVSRFTGEIPQRNKAIVGDNAFSHEAGVHQHGMVKERTTYEWINPEDYGNVSKLTFGPRSGRAGLREEYNRLHFNFTEDEFNEIAERFKDIADREKEIDDCHLIMAAAGDTKISDSYSLVSVKTSMSNGRAEAEISLKNREIKTAKSYGNGMIDAAVEAINNLIGLNMDIVDYKSTSATPGSDAQGIEQVVVKNNGLQVKGFGMDTDTVKGAVKAYLNAANRMIYSVKQLELLQMP